MRALKMLARIHGLHGHDKNLNRDWLNAVMKYGQKFQEDLDYLMDDRIEDYSERYESWRDIKRQNDDLSEQGKSDG